MRQLVHQLQPTDGPKRKKSKEIPSAAAAAAADPCPAADCRPQIQSCRWIAARGDLIISFNDARSVQTDGRTDGRTDEDDQGGHTQTNKR